jgi:hypothetical protein
MELRLIGDQILKKEHKMGKFTKFFKLGSLIFFLSAAMAHAESTLQKNTQLIQRLECGFEFGNLKEEAFLILSDYTYHDPSLPASISSYTGTVQFLSSGADSRGDCEFLSPLSTPEENRQAGGVDCKFQMDDGSILSIGWSSQPAGLPEHDYSIYFNASSFEGSGTIHCDVLN